MVGKHKSADSVAPYWCSCHKKSLVPLMSQACAVKTPDCLGSCFRSGLKPYISRWSDLTASCGFLAVSSSSYEIKYRKETADDPPSPAVDCCSRYAQTQYFDVTTLGKVLQSNIFCNLDALLWVQFLLPPAILDLEPDHRNTRPGSFDHGSPVHAVQR